MKIENSGVSSILPKLTEAAVRVEKKDERPEVRSVRPSQDKAEMSDQARLLAKARVALGNVEDTNPERLGALRNQIASGDYTIQVNDLARKLAAKFYPK